MTLTQPMWKGLAFLALHDRWRKGHDTERVRLTTIRSLTSRGFADMYPNESEAWIQQSGIHLLMSNAEDVILEYSLPQVAPGWTPGRYLPRTWIGKRLQLQAARETLREEMQRVNVGKLVLVRVRFVGLTLSP